MALLIYHFVPARMALRDVGEFSFVLWGDVDRTCKMIPFDPSRPLTLQSQSIENLDLKKKLKIMMVKN